MGAGREDRPLDELVGWRSVVRRTVTGEPVLVDAVSRQVECEGISRGVERRLIEGPFREPVAVAIEVGEPAREGREREARRLAFERLASGTAAQAMW